MNDAATHVADTIDGAADLLTSKGWTQGAYHNRETGEHCLVGALLATASMPLALYRVTCPGAREAMAEVAEYIRREQLFSSPPITITDEFVLVNFNDADGRTKDDVVNLLRKTAIDVRSRA